MNAVGKMLVVLQLCMSLLFICFAGAAYSVQGIWHQKANTANNKVADLERDINAARQDNERLLGEAARSQEEAERERDELRSERDALIERAETAGALLADLRQERDKALAENKLAADEARARRTEATDLRKENASLTTALADHLKEIRELEDQVIRFTQQLRSYKGSEQDNLDEIARLIAILRSRNISPNTRVAGNLPIAADKVDGRVTDRLLNNAGTQEFVRVTIGSNDGLEQEMVLTVYRKDKYICDVRVIDVQPDSASAIVIPRSRQSTVKRGDYVTTEL